jgi:signal peptidase II
LGSAETKEKVLKNILKTNGLLIGLATFIVFLDQLTKMLVRQNLAIGETWMPWKWLEPYARIVHWQNTGAAFGIFQNGNLVLTILAILVSVAIVIYYQKVHPGGVLSRIALSMQFGGALGNLVDRFKQGHVTDFFSVGTFPVFNVADACVTVGVGLLVLSILIQERKEMHLKEEARQTQPSAEAMEQDNDNQPD